ncbi:hypothetical protein [Streptomyces sp. NPDC013457]|uniref:hypothetical protein n=1 Tax=Streptomyces sp. NPDC013457 TaxID=3364866 RepID=UPI0036FC81A3
MSEFERGAVRRATFEVEYPDGTVKVAEIDRPQDVASILFDAGHIPEEDADTFNVSGTDWKQNPAMLVYLKDGKRSALPSGGGGGIPHCTHNGCKPI